MFAKLRWAVLLLALALAAFACDDGDPAASSGPLPEDVSGGVYLALGDSIAAGTGASDAERTSYVALVAEALRSHYGDELSVDSLAVGGHTTQDLVEHQLSPAVELLGREDVRLVTVTIGGNDLYEYGTHEACTRDPADPECPLQDGLVDVEERLDEILGELRAAGPDTTIAIQVYPNLFSGTGNQFEHQAETAFGLLNDVIVAVAQRYNVLVADPSEPFVGRGGELGHLLDPMPDPHPNDAGYRAIADAFIAVLGLSRAEDGPGARPY